VPPSVIGFSGEQSCEASIPYPGFASNTTIGTAPFTVQFTDLSYFYPTTWLWDFGDGTTSTEQHPIHTYAAPGAYTVSLNVSNAYGYNVLTKVDYIDIGFPPTVVGITIPYNTTVLNTPMWFNATADGATSYLWDFGDGTNSTAQNFKKSFTAEGDYFVTLTAMNVYGNTTIGREVLARKNVVVSDGKEWAQATAAAGWSARHDHTSVVYDDKMWVLGGADSTYKNDVWWSTDGVTWTRATAAAGWSARRGHTSLVYDDKMWVIGGYGGSYRSDAWWSTDGVTWTQATGAAGWSSRYEHASVVYDNKMWVMGGYPGYNKNDVWWSTDGVSWTQATSAAAWSARCAHTVLTYDNKMWVMGGDDITYKNDVWWSTDGVSWTQATSAAAWSARSYPTSVVYDNKMWVMGGGLVAPMKTMSGGRPTEKRGRRRHRPQHGRHEVTPHPWSTTTRCG